MTEGGSKEGWGTRGTCYPPQLRGYTGRRDGRWVGGRRIRRSGERGGVFAPCALKNGKCQNKIKKKKKRGNAAEREKWVKVRVGDRLKNEAGKENPV